MIYYIGLNVPARLKTVQPFENSDKNKLFNFASGKSFRLWNIVQDSQFLMLLSLALLCTPGNIERFLEGLILSSALSETNRKKRKIIFDNISWNEVIV